MLYVASAQPATAQLGALSCDFLQSGVRCLVINKLTRIEVWSVHHVGLGKEKDDMQDADEEEEEEGEDPAVKLVLEIPVWATIAEIQAVKLPGQSTSSILVLTTCARLFSLSYSATAPHILTTSTVSLADQYAEPSSYQAILVDPLHRCLLVHFYKGLARIVPLTPEPVPTSGKSKRRDSRMSVTSVRGANDPSVKLELDLARGYNVRFPTLNTTSITFLPSPSSSSSPDEDSPVIAFVFMDHLGRRILESRSIDLEERELQDGPIDETVLEDPAAEMVIPVEEGEGREGGALVVGEELVVWVQKSANAAKGKGVEGGKKKVQMPVGKIMAWTAVEGSLDKFLLGDIYGKLILLDVVRSASGRVVDLKVKDLGDTSSPTSIVHLSPTVLYLTSRFADSQLVGLPSSAISSTPEAMDLSSRTGEEESIQLIASFASLSPILDCCVVQGEGGGAGHVVTCSGAYKGGSLRIVRQGVGLSELASLEMENVQRIWALKREGSLDEILVLSSFNQTQIVSFTSNDEAAEEEIEEVDIPAFVAESATLLACHIGALYIQVRANGIGYSNAAGTIGSWDSEGKKKVTLAVSYGDFILLALEGGALVVLQVEDGQITQTASTQLANEIACLHIASLSNRLVASVGLWTSQTILLISVPDLKTFATQTLDSTYLIRSVLVTTFDDKVVHLFAGLGDGSLSSFVLGLEGGKISFVKDSIKTVTLGTRPIVMSEFVAANSLVSVFVSSDRPTVISRVNGKLLYSSVNLKNINAVAAFNSSAYPSSLALATPTELRIGRIEDIQRVDIRAIPLEDDEPRRIAHDAASKTYGVVCLRRDINRVTGEQRTQGCVKFFDDQSFEVLADIALEPNEECQSIAVVSVCGTNKYIVGTGYVLPSEAEPTKGRLLLYSETSARTFEESSARVVFGCAYALAPLTDNFFGVAVHSQVEIFSIDPSTLALTPAASWGGAFISLNLVSCPDNTLLVGDAFRSVTLLKFTATPTPKLEEVARDYNARYMAAVESLAGNAEYIGAETDLNFFTVLNEDTTGSRSMAEEHTLSARGKFHLGEMVSKFQHGALVQQFGENAGTASPRLIFSTTAGTLGVIVDLDATASKTLSDLERNMRHVVRGVGGLDQETWRSFKSEAIKSPPTGFVDGNFVEMFLEFSADEIDAVLAGKSENEKLVASKAELLSLVEELARMH